MKNTKNSKKLFVMASILLLGVLIQVQPAQAWSFDFGWMSPQRSNRVYTQVVVGNDRYYYNDGVYYTGAPGRYVIVEAPVGAVIYNEPAHYQRVDMDGEVYYRSHNAYYRHGPRGYEVVRAPIYRGHDNGRRDDGKHDKNERGEERGR
ncbi:MAG: hypothetical protein HQL15_02890 [Candidatus Omnitrophica bacterium]|nr:hypothetical protein [Candidatus Omnitrophota bacterium]